MSNVPVKGVRNDPFDESRIFFLLLHTDTQNILRDTQYTYTSSNTYVHCTYTHNIIYRMIQLHLLSRKTPTF